MNLGMGSFEFESETYAFVLTDADPGPLSWIHMKCYDGATLVFQNAKLAAVNPGTGRVILQKQVGGQMVEVTPPAGWHWGIEVP